MTTTLPSGSLPSGVAPMIGHKATGAGKNGEDGARDDFNQWLRGEPAPSRDSAPADAPAADAAATAAEVGEFSARADANQGLFGFRVRAGDGSEELIAVPWGLAASGRLSLLLQRAQAWPAASAQAPLAAGAVAAGAITADEGALAAAAPPMPVLSLYPAAPGDAAASPPPSGIDAAIAGAPEQTDASAGAPRAYAAPWLSRLVRWIERDQLSASVWIRDYALDEDGARRLAGLARELAQEHGVRLDRIVVNAREIWSAARGAQMEND